MTEVTICGGYDWESRTVAFCPVERRRRRFYGRGAAWYGTTWTCLGCGDRWQDGELGSRPFQRGWRKEAVAQARERWAAVPANWRDLRDAALRASFS